MALQGFDHLYIETQKFPASLSFWKTLGLEVLDEWGEDDHRACMLGGNGMKVVLVQSDPDGTPVMNVHLAMTDPETTMKELESVPDQVKVRTPLEDTHWGTQWIRLADPDGRTVCLEAPANQA
jgi:catechol 2,3-dioxygenase-like lactoylglutathione lyase family enzyme